MEFTKIRVRNLPTEEEYIQEKSKEYQALIKVPKFSLISNSVVALIALALVIITIVKSMHFDVGAFMITIVTFGGILFLCCKWNLEIINEYHVEKEKYELFQTYLSFDAEDETKFVQSDTEVCGKFTGLYFIRMLKEDPHPHVWCELSSETAAVLWFTYKEKKFMVPIAANGVEASMIENGECIYEFNGKDGGIIYYARKNVEKLDSYKGEIIIEVDDD